MLYLIHLDTPYHHARHYLGCTHDLDARLAKHRNGTGAKLLRAVNKAGIAYAVVRTWEGYRDEERQLKARKNAPRLCPVCIQERITAQLNLPPLPYACPVSTPTASHAPTVWQEAML